MDREDRAVRATYGSGIFGLAGALLGWAIFLAIALLIKFWWIVVLGGFIGVLVVIAALEIEHYLGKRKC